MTVTDVQTIVMLIQPLQVVFVLELLVVHGAVIKMKYPIIQVIIIQTVTRVVEMVKRVIVTLHQVIHKMVNVQAAHAVQVKQLQVRQNVTVMIMTLQVKNNVIIQ